MLTATILGSSLAFIDGTVVSVALPALQADLSATVTELQWVVESYALFLAALVLVGGAMGDRYGRRAVFVAGVVVFAIASAWCGLSPNASQLVLARAVQGVGAALLVPGSLAIIGAYFPEADRGGAIGIWSALTSVTTAIGPVLGGWLVENTTWRAAFFINLPLAVIVIALSLWRVPESRGATARARLDWWGALTAIAGLGLVVYGLLEWGNVGPSRSVLASTGLGVLLLVAFVFIEAASAHPMMPLGLFRSSTFSGANLLTLLLYAALGGMLFFLPLNLIQVQGYSPAAAGAAILPFIGILTVLSRWSGGLVVRHGARTPLVIGPAITVVGFGLLAVPGVGGSYWTTFFPAVVVLGFGMAVTVAPLTTTVMGAVQPAYVGVASGINNALSRVGGLLAVAAFGIVILVAFGNSLDARLDAIQLSPEARQAIEGQRTRLAGIEMPSGLDAGSAGLVTQAIREAYVDGFRLLMLLAAGLAAASAASAGLMISGGLPEAAGPRVKILGEPEEDAQPPAAA